MEIEKPSSKPKETFPNFYSFANSLQTVLDSTTAPYSTLDFFDSKSSEDTKAYEKKVFPLKLSDYFNIDNVTAGGIYDFTYFILDSVYLIALISGNNIHLLDLPKKQNSSFIFRETICLELSEKKDKVVENPLENIFKPPPLEKEFLNCCDFGYKIRTNSSRISYTESETDLVLACAGRTGLIYIITIDEGFDVDFLYGHINEVYSVKFATPNQVFNFQNILLSGSKDGSMILWNIKNEVKVAIFAPRQNPHSDVINVAWSPGCDYIASVGLESSVKVWMVNDKLRTKIEESHLVSVATVKNWKSIEVNSEIYKNNEAHKNFEWQIDQIEFYGKIFFFFFFILLNFFFFFFLIKFFCLFVKFFVFLGYSFLSKDAFGNVVFWIPNFEVKEDFEFTLN